LCTFWYRKLTLFISLSFEKEREKFFISIERYKTPGVRRTPGVLEKGHPNRVKKDPVRVMVKHSL